MKRAMAALLMLALSLPVHGEEPPPPRPKRKLEIAGGVLFGVGYVTALGLAIRYEQGELAVPVLGPLIDLHRCHDCTGSRIESGIIGGLVLDFAIQATGVALFTLGMIKHRRIVKY